MSKNHDKDRLSFTKCLRVQMSGRGYVTVKIAGTDICEVVDMDCARKEAINKLYDDAGHKTDSPAWQAAEMAWRDEMKKVEVQAIEQAKQLFKSGKFKRK